MFLFRLFRFIPKRLRWMGIGAAAAWLFDPEKGRTRRTELADRASAALRKTGDRLESKSEYAADKVQGLAHVVSPKDNGGVTPAPPSPTAATPTSPAASTR